MNIWLVQLGEPLPIRAGVRKQRLTLLSQKLVDRGHTVVRWASAFDHITKTMLRDGDTDIRLSPNHTLKLLKGLGYKKNISLRRYLDHHLIAWKFGRQARRMERPDVVVVATPPHNLAYSVVKFANRRGIPVIVDIRDQWPDIFLDYVRGGLRKVARFLLFSDFYYTASALSKANGLTAMMESLLEWGLGYAGRSMSRKDGVFYIGTDPAEETHFSDVDPRFREMVLSCQAKVIITYVGTFNRYYNPLIIVEVAKRFLEERRDDLLFIIAGSGELWDGVYQEASALPNVLLTGWLGHEEILFLLSNSDAAICPLSKSIPAFPNKVFMYLSAYLPVIASTPGDFRNLIEEYRIGFYYDPGDKDGLYNCVKALLDDANLRREMCENIKRIFDEKFGAPKIYTRFAVHIEGVARESCRRSPQQGRNKGHSGRR